MESEINDLILFIGRFHPLVVHLPIGFIMLGLGMHFIARFDRFKMLEPSVNFILTLGVLSGIAAIIMGFMLATEGGYNEEALNNHKYAGIIVTVLTLLFLGLRQLSRKNAWLQSILGLGTLVMLSVTGHLGGNMTHGSTYLLQYAPNPIRIMAGLEPKVKSEAKVIDQIDSVIVFQDVIKPMFESKCISCHSQDKMKGELLLTDYISLMKGGEHGPSIVPGNLGASELFTRITLPHESEDFMPPEGKTPLTKDQVDLIGWWIESGADPKKNLASLSASPEKIDKVEKYLGIGKYQTVLSQPIAPLSDKVIDEIKQAGFRVNPIALNVHYLEVVIRDGVKISDQELQVLEKAADHIVWLDLKRSGIGDQDLEILEKLEKLTKLRLDHNELTDSSVKTIIKLKNLEYLNISFTAISKRAIDDLKDLSNLKSLYYYQGDIKI